MTESQEGTKPYTEEEAYLYETYVTDDGIEVPPPTKVMGPRRLSRYREEAAEYIRAMGRGKLPEPVDHMGPVVNNLVVDPRVLSIQRRFAALAAQGAIDTNTNDEDKLNEPEPLTSSLNAIKQAKRSKDPTDLSGIPLTSSVTEPAPQTNSLPMHDYLVRDEPKVESDEPQDKQATQGQQNQQAQGQSSQPERQKSVVPPSTMGTPATVDINKPQPTPPVQPVAAESPSSNLSSNMDDATVVNDTVWYEDKQQEPNTGFQANNAPAPTQPGPHQAPAQPPAPAAPAASAPSAPYNGFNAGANAAPDTEPETGFADNEDDLRTTVHPTMAKGFTPSGAQPQDSDAGNDRSFSPVTPGAVSAGFDDSAADDPTVALDPDKVGELVRRIVEHNQEPEGEEELDIHDDNMHDTHEGEFIEYTPTDTVSHEMVDYDDDDDYVYEEEKPKRRGSPLTLIVLALCILAIVIGVTIIIVTNMG